MKTPDRASPDDTLRLLAQMIPMIDEGRFLPDHHVSMALSQSHEVIRSLMCRCGHLSKTLEVAEADRDRYLAISYGGQKGGAA